MRLFTLDMLTLSRSAHHRTRRRPTSVPSSTVAFSCAVVGLGVTSHVAFDHRLPDQPEDVITYVATLGVAVIIGWWCANVLAWAAALRNGLSIEQFTLPGTKRIAQVILAATLTTSCVSGGTDAPAMILVGETETIDTEATTPPTTAPPTTAPPSTAAPTTSPTTTPTTTAPPSDPPAAEAPPTNEPTTDGDGAGVSTMIESHQVIVVEGDNLWTLAADTLRSAGVTSPTTSQIAEYWGLVVRTSQVRSGDPDLIVAGEALTMPAFDLDNWDLGDDPTQDNQPSAAFGIPAR